MPLTIQSWVHTHEWPTDEANRCTDVLGNPVTPSFDNGFGFHAFHSWNTSNSTSPRLDGTVSQWASLGLVSGLMIGWGQTCIHTRGFRSEWAKPLCFIWEGDHVPRGLRDLGGDYAVPVMHSPEAALSYGEEWGRTYKAEAQV